MNCLKFVFAVILLSLSAYAGELCAEKEAGYEAFCAVQPSEAACNFHSQCIWVRSGENACSGKELSYQAFCSVQPSKAACEFFSECVWAD